MVKLPTLLEMLKAGVHFGHQTSKWHPKMKEYIFGARNGVHIMDLERTSVELEKTLNYVKTLASSGKVILFVGTKQQSRVIIKKAAQACGMPYLTERWIGGMLTNFSEVKKRLKRYHELEGYFASGEIEKYSKKEQLMLKKDLEKMNRYLTGIADLKEMPDALYIADLRYEKTAVAEANRMAVPIVAVTDSNVNPNKASYIIPGNDDAVNSIKMMADLISASVSEGCQEWEKKQAQLPQLKKVDAGQPARKVFKKDEDV